MTASLPRAFALALLAAASQARARTAMPAETITVVGTLDAARSQIEPGLGATQNEFSRKTIDALPRGDNAPLSQLLLQAPGVAQDSYGQIHVRGDPSGVQYRLDGVRLPEGLAVFGQALETRFASSIRHEVANTPTALIP